MIPEMQHNLAAFKEQHPILDSQLQKVSWELVSEKATSEVERVIEIREGSCVSSNHKRKHVEFGQALCLGVVFFTQFGSIEFGGISASIISKT